MVGTAALVRFYLVLPSTPFLVKNTIFLLQALLLQTVSSALSSPLFDCNTPKGTVPVTGGINAVGEYDPDSLTLEVI